MSNVFVGLSGGVDSSVSAALLKDAGHQVSGAFISVWQPNWLTCSQTDDRQDALRVAAQLDIPFIDIDAVSAYKEKVVDYMVREYQAGRTPNPDVMCNKHVKFGVFFEAAMQAGADQIATGHYCRKAGNEADGFQLLQGHDQNKDQSYFLWTITQTQLAKTLFPIGDYEKPTVRELATQYQLSTATKKDSQGLCFIGKLDIKEFLEHFVPEQTIGSVVNEVGETIGHHPGALFFTIGQRHGFTITQKRPDDTPYYVVAKDVVSNTLTVSQEPKAKSDNPTINLEQTNWIHTPPQIGKTYQARFRYRQPLQTVTVEKLDEGQATIHFTEPQRLIPSGQSLVLYDEQVCLGGGIIV